MGEPIKKVAAYLAKLSDTGYGVPGPISAAANYALDAYFAKLDFRAARNRVPNRRIPADPHAHIKELWLGCELHTAITLNRQYPTFARNLNAYAFSRLFSGDNSQYDVVPFLDTYEFKELLKGHFAYRIQSEQLSIGLNEWVTLPVYGNFFVKHRGTGIHLYISLDLCYESMGCIITVMASPDGQPAVEAFYADMQASILANDIYYQKCMTFVRGRLDFTAVTQNTWDDIVLKDDIKQQIQDNTVSILEHNETLASLGMCPNRNVILISPPGMAKTTIFRAIATQVYDQMSCIWCTGKSIERADDVTSLFQAARSLAPCIIFIEDMDLFGGDRSFGGENRVLNEFLACLDGTTENAGVVVMASTNDVQSMDEALINRPGRFDEKIEIPLPDAIDRAKMLANFFKKLSAMPDESVSEDAWKTVIDLTNGLTGAYLKDLAKSTIVRAVAEGRANNGAVTFTSDNLNGAATKVMKNYALGKRAKKHHHYEGDVDFKLQAG